MGGLCRRLWWLCHIQHDSCESCLSRAKITILAVMLQRTVALAIQLVSILVMTPSRRRDWLPGHVNTARRRGDVGNITSLTCDGRRPSCVITYCRASKDVPTEGLHVRLGDPSLWIYSTVTCSRHSCPIFRFTIPPCVVGVVLCFGVLLSGAPGPDTSLPFSVRLMNVLPYPSSVNT